MNIVYIALGGALGSVCRYGLSTWLQGLTAWKFPIGTFSVNVIGSLLIGLLYGVFSVNGILDDKLRMLVFVGFLGGFTTFSSFALENMALFQNGYYTTAAAYILLTNVIGIGAAFAGFFISSCFK